MALLVLLLVWGALIATWLRSRAQDGGFSDPVGTFNRHLRVLEQASPSRYAAANQRRPPHAGTIGPYRPVPSAGLGAQPPAPRRPRPSAGAAARRAESRKRRRDVFFALLAGTLGSLVLGVVPGLHAMLYVQAIFDLLLAGYVALLIRMRNLAAERETKLSYLPASRRVQPASYQPVTSRTNDGYNEADYDYDYLAVRRAAN